MRRLVLLTVAAATVTWIAGASGGSTAIGAADEAGTSVAPAVRSAALPPPRVTMITDSVGGVLYWATTAREALAEGLDFHLDTRACRKLVSIGCYAYEGAPPSALETIREIGPELGSIVIVNVGYNDLADSYTADLDTVMAALAAAGVRHVIWVTLEEAQGTWAQINVQIRAAPARWPGLVVADWATAVTGHPDWFADGVHMNELGGAAFSRFLRPFVLEACGPACVPPPPVPTLLAPVVRARSALLRWRGTDDAESYDLAVKRDGGAWRTVALRLTATSYRLQGLPGLRLRARVRARNAVDTPGPWSSAWSIRM